MSGCGRKAVIPGIRCVGLPERMGGLQGQHPGGSFLGPAARPLQQHPAYGLLRATIRGLRVHAPAAYPVIVRSGVNLPPDTDAYCTRRPSRFVIMLGQHLDPRAAVEAVLHEWAHARGWSHRHDRAVVDMAAGRINDAEFEVLVHDSTWGVEFAACWRVFTGVVLPGYYPAEA